MLRDFIKNFYIQNQRWVKLALLWFCSGLAVGAIGFFIWPELLELILQSFADRFGENPELGINLAVEIFKNNLIACLALILGGLLAGLLSYAILFINGFIIGFIVVSVIVLSDSSLAQSLATLLLGLVPHGIFEVPAFLAAGAMGLRLGLGWMGQQHHGARGRAFWNDFKYVCKFFPFLVLFLALAAIIEVFVTGNLLNNI